MTPHWARALALCKRYGCDWMAFREDFGSILECTRCGAWRRP